MFCSQASVTELPAESWQAVKVSPLKQAHGQDTKTEYRPVYVLLMCVVLENHFKESPTQLILKQKIWTSEVAQQAITQKFVSNKMDLILGCGGARGWEKKPGSQSECWFSSSLKKSPTSFRRQIMSLCPLFLFSPWIIFSPTDNWIRCLWQL